MDTNKMKNELLRLINNNDGRLSWYHLDRSLSYDEFLPMLSQMMPTLKQLEEDGLIKSEGDAPYYRMTDAGRSYLRKQQQVAA